MNHYHNINALEKSVTLTGNQLYTVANRLHAVEQSLDTCSVEDMDDMCVMELLETMTEVKRIEENLRKDIQEVQQLQRDVSTSLRYQMHSMQQTFQMLKKRIEMKAAENAAALSSESSSLQSFSSETATAAATTATGTYAAHSYYTQN